MGAYLWGFTLVTVALLLDPTFGDVLVQPGYNQPGQSGKNTVAQQSQPSKNQALGNSQQNYAQQQNPGLQLLQQQHALQQQYLQHQHQQEHNQLLQMQQHQLQNPGMYHQTGGEEVVGTPWGLGRYAPMYSPFGRGLHGAKLFSLGPLGLNSFGLGGLGGFPLLMSPQHSPVMVESNQYQKSMDVPAEPRTKRDVRDPGNSSERKFRQKARVQQDGVATNPSVKSKTDANSNAQTSKTNDGYVGNVQKNNENENVGSSILDPLGLMEKTEDLIDNLKSGNLPNPLHMLNGGRPHWLSKENSGNSQFEEHVVSQSQQYQYPQQGKSNNQYVTNQQYQTQPQSPEPVVGDVRQRPYSQFSSYPPPPGPYGPQYQYGTYRPTPYRPNGPSWFPRSNSMAYQGHPMTGASNPSVYQSTGQSVNWGGPMTGAANPAVQNPAMKYSVANSNSNDHQKTTGMQNPTVSKPQMMTEGSTGSGQSSSMSNDPIIGAPNPSQSSANGRYAEMVGAAPGQMSSFYELAQAVQPMIGTLFNPMTGSAEPAALNGGNYQNFQGRNTMVGNPMMMNGFYDPYRQMNYYGGGEGNGRSLFDFDDIFDDRRGYNHMHHGDRIYETVIDDRPYGYGGGHPHHMHGHQGYFL